MLTLFLTLFALAAAKPDPATLFETIEMPNPDVGARSDLNDIQNVLQEQGIILAEATFDSTLAKSACLARELCQFGAGETSMIPRKGDTTIGDALDVFTVSL